MASLVSSLFDLTQGNPAEHEQKQLGVLGDYETGVGEGLTNAGAGYEESILSGDPSRIGSALAPELSAGQGAIEGQRLQNANFGTRSGGTAASTEAAEAQERGNIINLIGGLQSGTAGAAVGQGSGLLGQASSNIGNEADLAIRNQQRLTSDVGGVAQGAAEIATGFAGGEAAPSASPLDTIGGADPLGLDAPQLPGNLISQYQVQGEDYGNLLDSLYQ